MIHRINSINQVRRLNSVPKAEAGFLPTDIAGCKLWLDFSDADTLFTDAGSTKVFSDGDLIYQANDKSGYGRHMTQVLSANRPLYKTNIKNNLSAAYFDGVDDYIEGVFAAFTTMTIFVVQQVLSTVDDQAMLFFGPKDIEPWYNNNVIYTEYKSSNRRDYQFLNSYDIRAFTTLVNYSGDFYQNTNTIDTTTAKVYINGVLGATDSHTAQESSMDYHIFGCRYNGGYEKHTRMHSCEVVFYDNPLSDEDRQSVETYLNNKWALY